MMNRLHAKELALRNLCLIIKYDRMFLLGCGFGYSLLNHSRLINKFEFKGYQHKIIAVSKN